jgi:hypothetical protein
MTAASSFIFSKHLPYKRSRACLAPTGNWHHAQPWRSMRTAWFHRSELMLPCIRARTKCATITSIARSHKQRNGHAQNERGDRGEERDAVGRQAATQLRRCRGFLLRGQSLRSAPTSEANLLSVRDRSFEHAKQVRCLCHSELEHVDFGEVGDGANVRLRIAASVCHSVGLCTCSRGAKGGR